MSPFFAPFSAQPVPGKMAIALTKSAETTHDLVLAAVASGVARIELPVDYML